MTIGKLDRSRMSVFCDIPEEHFHFENGMNKKFVPLSGIPGNF